MKLDGYSVDELAALQIAQLFQIDRRTAPIPRANKMINTKGGNTTHSPITLPEDVPLENPNIKNAMAANRRIKPRNRNKVPRK